MGAFSNSRRVSRPTWSGVVIVTTVVVLAAAWAINPPAAAQEAPPLGPPLSNAEREAFLLEAEVVKDESVPEGVTLPRRVTLRRGGYEHDALVQTHDEERARKQIGRGIEIDFRDTWKNNVAAYRLDKLLGLGFVPVTVVREYRRKPAAWTWWVDDMLMSDRERVEQKKRPPSPLAWISQYNVELLFDQLIFNFDRTRENTLIDKDWRLWMIDHTRAFKVFGELRNEKNLPARCERHLLAALRSLDRPTLEKTMEGLLNEKQIDGLLARRDIIVHFYDDAIVARGEPAVLYDLPSRLVSTADPGPQ